MRFYYSSPDSVGKWAWRDFLAALGPYWPLRFLNTFAQLAPRLAGGKQRWVLRDWLRRMKKSKAKETGLFFLDSGAFSLYAQKVRSDRRLVALPKLQRCGWFTLTKGSEFRTYVDEYAAFVKAHLDVIDYYANVDVIFHPPKSWEVLKYLEEEHGLSPVPVLHLGAGLDWFRKHLDAGYEYLGIGGVSSESTGAEYVRWADKVFGYLCPPPACTPAVRTHGFALTAYPLLLRYPWWSVDSATWTKVGAYGSIMVPRHRGGSFTFDERPYVVATSIEAPTRKLAGGKHFDTMKGFEKKLVRAWLEEINVPFGSGKKDEPGWVPGVCNRHSERKMANLLFFERFREWLGPYPRTFGHRGAAMKLGAW